LPSRELRHSRLFHSARLVAPRRGAIDPLGGGQPCHRAAVEPRSRKQKTERLPSDGPPSCDEGSAVSKQRGHQENTAMKGLLRRWSQIRAAGTTSFVEICPDRKIRSACQCGLLDGRTADGMVMSIVSSSITPVTGGLFRRKMSPPQVITVRDVEWSTDEGSALNPAKRKLSGSCQI